MDFLMHYTAAQEEFRREIKAWIRENYPSQLRQCFCYEDMNENVFALVREFRRKLGQKGWLAPLYPREYGGGGLTAEHAIVLDEELWELDVPMIGDLGVRLAAPAISVWGTEEQKRRFLPPILRGEVITWQCFSEPEAGSDEANQKTTALRDGDFFVINGQKTFIGEFGDVDFLYTLAVTVPSAPRRLNLGAFLVPANLPGITIQAMRICAGGEKRQIFYDNVIVPASQLIGKETDGWQVSRTTLDLEHSWLGMFIPRDRFVEWLFTYCRETKRNGQPLSKDPDIQQTLVEIYIDAQVERLLGMRMWWMFSAGRPITYEGTQLALYMKLRATKLAKQMVQILGPYSLTTDPKWRPVKGRFEIFQRLSLLVHAGGTPEILKLLMARDIGIGKVKSA
jgi:alkylation response protein AidB-like acyl-CoA dehydrogenase